MKIAKVVIENFRNIEHKEYILRDKNIFAGPNYQGKTNTLLAIYWLLTGYQLDGSSDDASNKPNMSAADSKKTVSVLLEFEDESTIKKTYAENWVKNRGTKEVALNGNITQYYINDDKTIAKEAMEWLSKKLGTDRKLQTSKFDLTRAILDPYYMGQICDWKTLRAFVIELVGDVSNDDVYNSDQILLNIKGLLTKYEHDTSKTIKHLKSHIVKSKEEIDTKEIGIKSFKEIYDEDREELYNAEAMIDQLDSSIASYNQQLLTAVNPNIQKLENEKAELNVQLSEQLTVDQKKLAELNADAKNAIKNHEKAIEEWKDKKEKIIADRSIVEYEQRTHTYDLNDKKRELERKTFDLEKCRNDYKALFEDAYVPAPLPKIQSCPHCGGILNDVFLESAKKLNDESECLFNSRKASKLEANVALGKSIANEIKNLQASISETEATAKNYDTSSYTAKLAEIEQFIQIEEVSLHSAKKKLVDEFVSGKTNELRSQINVLDFNINEEKSIDTTSAIKDKISDCKERKAPFTQIISNHNLYLVARSKIKSINLEMDKIADILCGYENQLVLVEKFMQTKLSMLKGNVEKVFGIDVNFTLVETNIKEGSWNEVCYPSVIYKKTPFAKGSGSEKIITGIYLIECVKKTMGIPDVPILFDECDKLDTQSLATRLNTNAQIITTKVDDISYTDVTLIIA